MIPYKILCVILSLGISKSSNANFILRLSKSIYELSSSPKKYISKWAIQHFLLGIITN